MLAGTFLLCSGEGGDVWNDTDCTQAAPARGTGLGAGAHPGAVGLQFAGRRQNSKNALYFKSRDADENNEEGGGPRGSWAVLGVAPCPEQANGAGSDRPAEERGHSTLGFVVSSFGFLFQKIQVKTNLDSVRTLSFTLSCITYYQISLIKIW